MSNTIYYVYAWLKKNGEPYYIGKGKNNRAWRKGHGIVQIIASNLTEDEAFNFESLLIKKIGRKDLNEGPLHNKNDGMFGGDTSHYENYKIGIKNRRDLSENFGDRSGQNNGMHSKGHLITGDKNGMFGTTRGKECTNKRLICPICQLESNSSNIKRHIKIKHNREWMDVLTDTK